MWNNNTDDVLNMFTQMLNYSYEDVINNPEKNKEYTDLIKILTNEFSKESL